MSTRLENSNTSREIGLSRYFRRYTEKPDLLVLVEGEDDIPFWTLLLDRVRGHYAHIDVTDLKVRDELSGEEKSCNGKDSLMKVTGLGSSKVIAVDRDYDNLVANYHPYSTRVGSDPYVLYTRFYAMENHKLHPDVVNTFLSDRLHETCRIDFHPIVQQFSLAIADVLLLLIVYERKCAQLENPERNLREITVSKLEVQICKQSFHYRSYQADFQSLSESLRCTFSTLLERYRSEIEDLREELSVHHRKYEADYWQLLQGHTLYAVMRNILQGVLLEKKREHEQVIREQETGEAIATAICAYNRTLGWNTTNVLPKLDEAFVRRPYIAEQDWEEHFERVIGRISEEPEQGDDDE